MTKQKPSPALIAAIRAVHPSERRAAILLADRTFARDFAQLEAWGDFSTADHIEMAMDNAVAEVTCRFA